MNKSEPLVKELLKTVPQIGLVNSISIRPKRIEMPLEVLEISVDENGLVGDHFHSEYTKKRAVTFIQKEHIAVVSSIMNKPIDPLMLRRNIVISGINILSLKNQRFQIGDCVFEGTELCHPCSRMEENLGTGGWNAMRGHGGLTASVVHVGKIKVGDEVRLLPD